MAYNARRDAEYNEVSEIAIARAMRECERYEEDPDEHTRQFIRRYAKYTQKAYHASLERTRDPRFQH